ncbi:MAG: hypothetical protein C4542_08165 [Dehalococcoidia bacterium]|nr:MAG: hypothetical protein C4542_08165 [Dehalococcoidia bacterium]
MTGRQLITSALRAVNAIGSDEAPEYGMFENARETLNLLLGSWSAEELMPHHYSPVTIPLFANTPNYTINNGTAFDSDAICLAQTPAAGGSQALTINGTLASSGVATTDVPRHVIIASTADDSARTFTIVGTNDYGDKLTEVVSGPNTATTRGLQRFKTVTSVTVDDDTAGAISVGTDYIINVRRPVKIVSAILRDSDGYDAVIKVIDKNRYDEIGDKDEAGAPTKLYYDRVNPTGEVYIHPVPATGVALGINTGTECISNGGFGSSTGWTLDGGTYWSISGGQLIRTAPVSEMLNNTSFDTTGSWTISGNGSQPDWVISGGKVAFAQNGDTLENLYQATADMVSALQPLTQYTVTVVIEAGPVFTNSGLYISLGAGSVNQGAAGTSSYINTAGTHAETVTTPAVIHANGVWPLVQLPGLSGTQFSILSLSVTPVDADDTVTQLDADLAASFVPGDKYTVTFDTEDVTDGTVSPAIGGTSGPAVSWNDSHSFEVTCGVGADFELVASSDFTGKVDNVSVSDLPYSTLTPVDYQLIMDLWLPFVEIDAANVDDDIGLPGEYLLALRWNLAAELVPEYGKEVLPYVIIRARQTKDTIKMLNGIIPKKFNAGRPVPSINGQPAITRIG